jgi:hypothetical protein
MKDLKNYIKDLKLSRKGIRKGAFESISALEATGVEEPSFLNFKSLNSFVTDVSESRRSDVLNSLLLAQRAATKAFPNEDQIVDWYKKYYEVLSTIGWVIENQDFTVFDTSNALFEVDKAIFEIITTALTGNQLAILMKTIETFKNLGEDDNRFVAFERNTHTLQKGSFQLGVATEVNGTVSISSFAFIINSSKRITKILFFKSSKDETEFRFSLNKATLNEDVFAQARPFIKQKLGNVGDFIISLDI